jgi:hypothetical protein
LKFAVSATITVDGWVIIEAKNKKDALLQIQMINEGESEIEFGLDDLNDQREIEAKLYSDSLREYE